MSEIDGIKNADGLTTAQTTAIEQLVDVYNKNLTRNTMLHEYYDGDITITDFGVEIDGDALKNDAVCYWPQKAVDVLAERIRFDGFVLNDDEENSVLDGILRRNRMLNAYKRFTPSKLIHGCSFACVNNVDNHAEIKFHSAETAAAIPDGTHDSGTIGAGMVIARTAVAPWSFFKRVPSVVNVYLPGQVVILTRENANKWTAKAHDLEEQSPMMFAFTHKANGHKPFGVSRISKAVRGYTRAAMRAMYHMQASGAFYAFPQRAIMGLTDEQFEEMVNNKQKMYVDNVLLGTRDAEGNSPSLYQITGNSPQPFIDELRCYAGFIAGATGVPLTSLGIVQDNPASADAMTSAREDLCVMAQSDADDDKEVLNKLITMALAVELNLTVDELMEQYPIYDGIMAHFQSPFIYSESAQADSAMKIATVAPWYSGTDVFLEKLNFDQPTISRMRRDRDEYKASATLDALISSMTPTEQMEQVDDSQQSNV